MRAMRFYPNVNGGLSGCRCTTIVEFVASRLPLVELTPTSRNREQARVPHRK
jgi:hypothetical protein